jgi:hypothetical protein
MEEVQYMASIWDNFDLDDLVDFEEKRKYSNIEFEWMHTVGPTALKFLPYDILGEQYKMS